MKKILINIVSNSLGDTIACTPYVSEYQKLNGVEIIQSVNDPFIFLLENSYPNIKFVGRNESITYDERFDLEYVFNKSIQSGYADKNKYITIGVHSTCQVKYWNHSDGLKSQIESKNWNELSSILRKRGYTPVTLEKDEMYGVPPFYNGIPSKSNKQIGKTLLEAVNIINHSEFYIGLSSGLSWVAHALGKKVVMISNFTEDWNEFDLSLNDYIRITNKSVCHGCWNKINVEHTFDKHDWYWCPLHKNTDRQFECHKSISVNDVVEQINKWL